MCRPTYGTKCIETKSEQHERKPASAKQSASCPDPQQSSDVSRRARERTCVLRSTGCCRNFSGSTKWGDLGCLRLLQFSPKTCVTRAWSPYVSVFFRNSKNNVAPIFAFKAHPDRGALRTGTSPKLAHVGTQSTSMYKSKPNDNPAN